MRARWAGVLVLMAAFALPAGPAVADDAQLWAAYSADNPEYSQAARQWDRALKRFERNPRGNYRAVVRTSNRLAELTNAAVAQFDPIQPSSSSGTKIKALVQSQLREMSRGYKLIATAAKNVVRGRRVALSQAKRADQAFARAERYRRRAVRAFKALGFS